MVNTPNQVILYIYTFLEYNPNRPLRVVAIQLQILSENFVHPLNIVKQWLSKSNLEIPETLLRGARGQNYFHNKYHPHESFFWNLQ